MYRGEAAIWSAVTTVTAFAAAAELPRVRAISGAAATGVAAWESGGSAAALQMRGMAATEVAAGTAATEVAALHMLRPCIAAKPRFGVR